VPGRGAEARRDAEAAVVLFERLGAAKEVKVLREMVAEEKNG
jgi:hypothetical protein